MAESDLSGSAFLRAVQKRRLQPNKLSMNNIIRHEYQNGICGGCFFTLFDGYVKMGLEVPKIKRKVAICPETGYNRTKRKFG